MKKLFLDTSGYSGFKKGNPAILEAIREADEIRLNPIVIGELLSGFDGGRFAAQHAQRAKDSGTCPGDMRQGRMFLGRCHRIGSV